MPRYRLPEEDSEIVVSEELRRMVSAANVTVDSGTRRPKFGKSLAIGQERNVPCRIIRMASSFPQNFE